MKAAWTYTIKTTDGYKAKRSIAGETCADTSEEVMTKIAHWFLSDCTEDDDPWRIELEVKRAN